MAGTVFDYELFSFIIIIIQTWDLLEIMYYGFHGLCTNFLRRNPGYFFVVVRISGSAIESVFSCLKYISGGNLSAFNHVTSLSDFIMQWETSSNCKSEGYINVPVDTI